MPQIMPRGRFGMVTFLFLIAGCGGRMPPETKTLQGTASDLGPPLSVGGVSSLTCPAMNEAGEMETGYDSFVSFCAEQNELLQKNGYPSCAAGQCLDTYSFQDNQSSGNSALVIRMNADLINGGFALSFSYQWNFGPPGTGKSAKNYTCASVAELWKRNTKLAREGWSFDRYLAKCL